MLFITNRAFKEGIVTKVNRKVTFDLKNNQAAQSVFFCERRGKDSYIELGSEAFLERLKKASQKQILIYLHGYSNLPEPDIFPRTEKLQAMCDQQSAGEVLVLPLIWPCDGDLGILKDYYDDQVAADASAIAFSRVFGKFLDWREQNLEDDTPCLKRISVLAHSMGNRVLRGALQAAAKYQCPGGLPLIFRNIFLVAADIVNESLEPGCEGEEIPVVARNVVVYFASDDLALRSSKIANLANQIASRRLGHTGPEDMDVVPKNVFAVDCDDVNTAYDRPKGHSYFLYDQTGKVPGKVFMHIWATLLNGRVQDLSSESARTLQLA
ncbi:MAG: alpha/beta hydrolase [Nibricoccus sp.]